MLDASVAAIAVPRPAAHRPSVDTEQMILAESFDENYLVFGRDYDNCWI